MRDNRLQFFIQSALFAAIIAVLAQISIPMPGGVPITLQTFAVALCGFFLGLKALLAIAIYILVGAIGIPVFAQLKSGIGTILGNTGGFIIGFIPMTFLCGCSKLFKIKDLKAATSIIKVFLSLVIALIGLAICHYIGALHFAGFTKKSFYDVLPLVSYPFLVKDILSVIFAYFLAFALEKRIGGFADRHTDS